MTEALSPRRRRLGGPLLWWSIAAFALPVAAALFLFGFLIDPERAGIERDLQRAAASGKVYIFGDIDTTAPWWKLAISAIGYADYPPIVPFNEDSAGADILQNKIISGPIRSVELFDEPGDIEGFNSALLRARRLHKFLILFGDAPPTEKSRKLIATLGALPELEEVTWLFTEPCLMDESWFQDLAALPRLRKLTIVIKLPRQRDAYRFLTIPGRQLLAVQAVHQMYAEIAEPPAGLTLTVYVIGHRKSRGGDLTPFPNPPLAPAN